MREGVRFLRWIDPCAVPPCDGRELLEVPDECAGLVVHAAQLEGRGLERGAPLVESEEAAAPEVLKLGQRLAFAVIPRRLAEARLLERDTPSRDRRRGGAA